MEQQNLARPQTMKRTKRAWRKSRRTMLLILTALVATTSTTTQAFVSQQYSSAPNRIATSSEWRPTNTSHYLFPVSVAATADAWITPSSTRTSDAVEQDHPYTTSLQRAPWVRRRRVILENDAFTSPLIPAVGPRGSQARSRTRRFRVYCDLDGVLVDFCHGIRNLFPNHQASQSVDALHRPTMWQKVAAEPAFFAQLPWMPDGQRLWHAIRPLQPDILTGVPYRVQPSSAQKFAWCQRELGVPVQHIDKAFGTTQGGTAQRDPGVCTVITTWSNDKHIESGPGAVLIDDRIELKQAWEEKGGIFIHHSGCVDTTLAELRHHGVLPDQDDDDPLLP